MTEITRVPLRPIAKGSLTKLWIGVALAIGLAVLLAWAVRPASFGVTVLEAGDGASPGPEDVVFVNYTGRLKDGTIFDQTQALPLPVEGIFPEGSPLLLSNVVPGFRDGVVQMQTGGRYELRIPPDQAYGDEPRQDPTTGEVVIPANSELIFEIELIDFMSQPEFERRVGVIQQMMAEQGMPLPGGPPPPPAEGQGGETAPAPAPE